MKNLSFLLCLNIFLFSGCEYSNQWQTVTVNDEFTADIPSWMSKTDELLAGAPFQYCNRFRNVYFVVIKDKQDTLPEFPNYVARNISILKAALDLPKVVDSTDAELGSLAGVHSDVMGSMGNEKVYYSHYSLQGKHGYNYQLCIWTRGEERKLRYNEDMNRMIESFRAL